MRFIAKYAKYAVQVRPQVVEAFASGGTRIAQEQLVARFAIGEVNSEERALARQLWSFNGFYQEQDLVTIVEPDYRISAFDSYKAQTEGQWTDAERETVERALTAIAIDTPQDVIRIEEKELLPPWPSYDSFPGDRSQLVEKINDDGFDLVEVLAYERAHQNREEIVSLMERMLEDLAEEMPRVVEEELVG